MFTGTELSYCYFKTGLGYLERNNESPKSGLLMLAQQGAQGTGQVSIFRRACMYVPPAPFAHAPSERQAGLWQISWNFRQFSGKRRLGRYAQLPQVRFWAVCSRTMRSLRCQHRNSKAR